MVFRCFDVLVVLRCFWCVSGIFGFGIWCFVLSCVVLSCIVSCYTVPLACGVVYCVGVFSC